MACDQYKTYTTASPVNFIPISTTSPFAVVYSEQWLDDLPRQLIDGGMSCQDAKIFIASNWNIIDGGDGNFYPRLIVKAQSFVDICSAFSWNTGSGGTWTLRDLLLQNPNEIGGSNSQFICTPTAPVQADGSWGNLIFNGFVASTSRWNPVVECIDQLDIDRWFCCRTECCGSTIPGGSGGFLIPAPTLIAPVDEKASIPILNNPLYLANHTWAFRNNFGRIPK